MTALSARSDLPPTDDFSMGPGHRLRQEREAHGVSLERLAAELHLAPAVVEAIEEGRYEGLPAPVYVVGYLRNYARLFNLDPEPVIQAYRQANPGMAHAATRVSRPSSRPGGGGGIIFRLVTLAIVVALVALVGLWWQGLQAPLDIAEVEDGSPPVPAATDLPAGVERPLDERIAGTPVAAEDQDEPSAPASQPASAMAEVSEPLEMPPSTGGSLEESPTTPLAGDQGESPGESVAGPPEVELVFDGPCWVDIRDSTREFKIFGEMGKGDRRTLGGTPPYSIIIGNAAATTIMIDGEPFDLESRARGNVARFTLDPTAAP
ncbi:hypothetical protein Thimo_1891 [Thioflavicoccus mobilis 8321]|uniref:HTH cro/C1-type domain-containing protein n=1 Tax=Thioflavicoccus mobilis 8321 TaxID=765912 RepID=L0GXV5_9GAMM|nr:RodZ domain-containing protein [Thioflavicoccus mobilis]AGA90657.1 hypothetical protein Thimo_1891 [Thioflavicoccus mobilis 8321]